MGPTTHWGAPDRRERCGSAASLVRPRAETYADALRSRFGERLRSVALFGSFARGEAHEDSDVDVLVLVDDLTEAERWDAAGYAAPIAMETGLPLAPILMATGHLASLRRSERLLARVIDSEGIAL